MQLFLCTIKQRHLIRPITFLKTNSPSPISLKPLTSPKSLISRQSLHFALIGFNFHSFIHQTSPKSSHILTRLLKSSMVSAPTFPKPIQSSLNLRELNQKRSNQVRHRRNLYRRMEQLLATSR